MTRSFGPWTTAACAGSKAHLSTFRKRRLAMLSAVRRSSTRLGGRAVSFLLMAAALVWILPTLRAGESKATGAAEPESLAFGPVIRTEITTQDRDALGLVFFDMETGKSLKPPFSLKLTNREPDIVELTPELKQWIKANDVDILFHFGSKRWEKMRLEMQEDFVGQSNEWETIKPAKVLEYFVKKDAAGSVRDYLPGTSSGMDYRGDWSSCQAFRTRTNTMGVLQHQGFDKTLVRGVTFQYKLVHVPAADKNAGGRTPSAGGASGAPLGTMGARAERPEAPGKVSAVEPKGEQAKAIAEIQKLGGKVTINKKDPDKPKIWVYLRRTRITDAELSHLKALTNLQVLDLSQTPITDAGLVHLEGLRELTHLVLSGTKVTDAGLPDLAALANLQSLALSHANVTDAGLKVLRELRQLQGLDLIGTKITGAGLEHLEGLTHLRYLELSQTQVTDAGLEHLEGLTNARVFLLNTKVTPEGAKRLQKAIPTSKVYHWNTPGPVPQF